MRSRWEGKRAQVVRPVPEQSTATKKTERPRRWMVSRVHSRVCAQRKCTLKMEGKQTKKQKQLRERSRFSGCNRRAPGAISAPPPPLSPTHTAEAADSALANTDPLSKLRAISCGETWPEIKSRGNRKLIKMKLAQRYKNYPSPPVTYLFLFFFFFLRGNGLHGS